ncbi:MAG: hypothetical protein QOC93_1633 [Actinomycetota bacterium]|jgi:uncharacterized protein YndB with AHSA1/START domain|nr:polyketide cyclase [Cryptosporangiaceae bacterium]MDQ1676489.1 hypothetical protein [Actinomycetota bacterium]
MGTITRTVATTPDRVFAILADGWTYSGWVVGCSHIRNVDAGFPAPGTKIHHSVGVWPATVEDTTEVVEVEDGKRLVLEARVWPVGKAKVAFTLAIQGEETIVTMEEETTGGPGKILQNPVTDPILDKRNDESLSRLFAMAIHRGPALYPEARP